MIIRPAWCKDAVPTLKGWKHPKRREILQSRSFTQEQIDEWLVANGAAPAPAPKPTPKPKVEAVPVISDECICEDGGDCVCDMEIEDMSKEQLEKKGRSLGIELDRRKSKKVLIKELKEHM